MLGVCDFLSYPVTSFVIHESEEIPQVTSYLYKNFICTPSLTNIGFKVVSIRFHDSYIFLNPIVYNYVAYFYADQSKEFIYVS